MRNLLVDSRATVGRWLTVEMSNIGLLTKAEKDAKVEGTASPDFTAPSGWSRSSDKLSATRAFYRQSQVDLRHSGNRWSRGSCLT